MPLTAARLAAHAAAVSATPTSEAVTYLSPRNASCAASSYAEAVLGDVPVSYWRLDAATGAANCGIDSTAAAFSAGLSRALVGASPTFGGLSAPVFLGSNASYVTAAIPFSLVNPFASLFTTGTVFGATLSGVTLEALVYLGSPANTNAAFLTVDLGDSGVLSLSQSCAAACFAGSGVSATLSQYTQEATCAGGSLIVSTASDPIPVGVWTHVLVAMAPNSAQTLSGCPLFGGFVEIYVAGKLVNSSSRVDASHLASAVSSLAEATVSIGANFKGSVLEVAM